jgi:hypothetical protein
MFGCVVGLIVAVLVAVVGLIRVTIMLMATSVSSLVVGPDRAAERIADSWIEQSAGQGVNIGYNTVTRSGVKAGAWILLIVGWIVTIGVIVLILSMIVNS